MSWESPSRNPPEYENEGEKGHGSSVANPSPEGGFTSSNLSPVAEVEVELHSGNDGSMSNPNSSKADRRPPTDADDPKVERRTKMRLDRSVSLKPPLPPKEKAAASSSKSNLSSPVEILRDKPPFEIPVPRPRNPLREDDTFTTRIHYNGVMETLEGGGKRYVNGECDYVHKCDMDKWSKLEVDDALEKRGVDVTGLEYFYLFPRMTLEDGLVRLFDNQSAIDMANLGVYYGVVDVYAVQVGGMVIDAAEGPEMPMSQLPMSQLTQEEVQNEMEEERWDYNENLSPVRVTGTGARRDDEEFDDEVVATKKGKRKVDDVEQSKRRSKAKGKEKEKEKETETETVDDDVPTFFDSDYDLSDKEEDEIMEAQVQGWKNVVASMRVIDDRDEEASSDNLPTDSPSEGESEDDLGGEGDPDMPQVVSRRFKPATDFNDPRWEIGLRFNSKNDFKEVIRDQG